MSKSLRSLISLLNERGTTQNKHNSLNEIEVEINSLLYKRNSGCSAVSCGTRYNGDVYPSNEKSFGDFENFVVAGISSCSCDSRKTSGNCTCVSYCPCNTRCACNNRKDVGGCSCVNYCSCDDKCTCHSRAVNSCSCEAHCTCNERCKCNDKLGFGGCHKYHDRKWCDCDALTTSNVNDYVDERTCSCNLRCECNSKKVISADKHCSCNLRCECDHKNEFL